MKILISGSEIANNIYSMKEALSLIGHDVTSCIFSNSAYYSNANSYDHIVNQFTFNYDYYPRLFRVPLKLMAFAINNSLRPFRFCALLFKKYDAYIYIWRTTYVPFKLDLFILGRLLKKNILIIHCGDDTRYRPIQFLIDTQDYNLDYVGADDISQLQGYLNNGSSFASAFWTQKMAEWSGAKIMSLRSHATFQRKESYFFRFAQKQLMSNNKLASKKPLIIHAPSLRISKGTKYVLEAIEILREKSLPFEFELIENKPNEYVLQRLRDADILIDQTGPWFGRLGMEGLACSCVLFSGNREDYYGIKDASPVIQFDPDPEELALNIERLLANESLRQDLMTKGYAYWQTKYSMESFAKYVVEILNGEAKECLFCAPPKYKETLLKYASNRCQKVIIQLFY
jgi:glycosyltransferase involved in cell wall biosynthesis